MLNIEGIKSHFAKIRELSQKTHPQQCILPAAQEMIEFLSSSLLEQATIDLHRIADAVELANKMKIDEIKARARFNASVLSTR